MKVGKEIVERELGYPISNEMYNKLETEPFDLFTMFESFWENNKFVKYYEHKFDSYKNNKKKLYIYNKGFIFMEEPYKEVDKNGTSYGFNRGKPKKIDQETIDKYFKEISKNDFFYKQIEHIPTI